MTVIEVREKVFMHGAALLLALLLVVPSGRADASTRAWVLKLRSHSPAERVMAQAYIARSGVHALAELDKAARTRDRDLQQRIRAIAELMLLKSVRPDEMRDFKNLWRVLEPAFGRASMLYRTLAGQKDYDSGAVGLPLPSPPRLDSTWEEVIDPNVLTEPRKAVKELLELRGVAVPAALELLTDKQPGSRMYGVEILSRLDAIGHLPELRNMLNDDGPIVVSHGCTWEKTTVGANARYWFGMVALRIATDPQSLPSTLKQYYAYAFEAEGYLAYLLDSSGIAPDDMLNRLDREAKTRQAVSWDDFWLRAQPVLEAFLTSGPD